MEYKKQNHAVYYTRYHLIFTTKFRRKLLKGGMGRYLTYLIRGVQRYYPEICIIDINTDNDHVHILLSLAPKLSISDAVRIIKSNTARQMKRKFPFLTQGYFIHQSIWSIGYFVSTVGINESTIKKYIEMQGEEDSGQAQLVLT